MKRTGRLIVWSGASVALLALGVATTDARGEAKGTLTYKAKAGPGTVAVKHATLFKCPDMASGNCSKSSSTRRCSKKSTSS